MSKRNQRLYALEEKAKIVLEAIKTEKTLAQIGDENDFHINNILNRKKEALENLPF